MHTPDIQAATREDDAEGVLTLGTPWEQGREKPISCSPFQDVVKHFLMQGEEGSAEVAPFPGHAVEQPGNETSM